MRHTRLSLEPLLFDVHAHSEQDRNHKAAHAREEKLRPVQLVIQEPAHMHTCQACRSGIPTNLQLSGSSPLNPQILNLNAISMWLLLHTAS